jgi:hypothetical protein
MMSLFYLKILIMENITGFSINEYKNLPPDTEVFAVNIIANTVDRRCKQEGNVHYYNCFKTPELAYRDLCRQIKRDQNKVKKQIKQMQNYVKNLDNKLESIKKSYLL